jgi:tRNA pseudouridine38-40 synthase
MARGAAFLTGEHDFSAFRAQDCQSKSAHRNMYFIRVHRESDQVVIDFCANAFLHHMVRNIAGVLLEIGSGKRPPEWAREVLNSRNRASGAATAPPDGLYFAGICYPEQFGFPRHPIFQYLPPNARRFSPDPIE